MPRSRSSLRSMSSNDLYATTRVSFSMVGCGLLAVLKDRLLLLALGLSMVKVVCATIGLLLGVWFWFMFIISFWLRIEKEEKENSKIPNFSPSISPSSKPHSSKEKPKKNKEKNIINFSERNNSNQECLPAPLILSFTFH